MADKETFFAFCIIHIINLTHFLLGKYSFKNYSHQEQAELKTYFLSFFNLNKTKTVYIGSRIIASGE